MSRDIREVIKGDVKEVMKKNFSVRSGLAAKVHVSCAGFLWWYPL